MKRSARAGRETIGMSPTDGALELWSSIVVGLRQAGYEATGAEYLRLSRILTEQCTAELLAGRTTIPRWAELRRVGAEAVALLGPVFRAASLLAELPTNAQVAPPPNRRRSRATTSRQPAPMSTSAATSGRPKTRPSGRTASATKAATVTRSRTASRTSTTKRRRAAKKQT